MSICYNENEVYTGPPISYNKINANRSYLRHYENSLLLQFMMLNGDMRERAQASKEMGICQRKMERMEKHANFNWDAVLPEIEKLKKLWAKA
jgi:hypothetical protein